MTGNFSQRDAVPLRALVVDDDEATCDFCEFVLKRAGFIVETATDGLTALRLLQAGGFAIAVCDIRMPMLDGLSIARNMQKHDARCPIIVITANEDSASRRQAEALGAQYLQKPVTESALRLAVSRALPGHIPPA